MIRPWLRRAKGYPHPQRLPGAKTCYPRCKKNYRKIPKISPGAYIFQRPFLRDLFFGGAYIWRGLYMEGLIFGILRYTLSNNKKSLKEHFTNLLCIFPTSWLATGGEPDRRRKKIMTHEPTNRQRLFYTKTKETKNFLSENRSWNNKQ